MTSPAWQTLTENLTYDDWVRHYIGSVNVVTVDIWQCLVGCPGPFGFGFVPTSLGSVQVTPDNRPQNLGRVLVEEHRTPPQILGSVRVDRDTRLPIPPPPPDAQFIGRVEVAAAGTDKQFLGRVILVEADTGQWLNPPFGAERYE